MKVISGLLEKLPFRKKEKAEKRPVEKREKVSFEGFWTENFSREAIAGKWTVYRDSFKGDSEDAKKTRKTAVTKIVLISVAVLLSLLSTMMGELLPMQFGKEQGKMLSESLTPFRWNGKLADLQALVDEAEDEEVVYDPDAEVKLIVPFYSQRDYPTGCELVSTSMLLAKYGIKITADEIVKKGYIKTKEVYLDSRGDPYGPDPHMTFIGDPLEDNGYGCYSGAIVKALKKIVPKDKYKVVDLTGEDLEDICREYVDKGIPVLYWGSLKMEPLYYDVVNHWYIDEGKRKGEEFKWMSNEHCMVLIGHNKDNYIFNDPSVDRAGAEYIRPIVEKRFKELGKQSVAIVPVE